MIQNRFIACTFILILFATTSATAAGKITTDPNSPGAKIEQPGKPVEIDERLNQLMTYDSGSKRLHYVTEDLSKMSGVSIFCGNNKDNWQVRDIPIIVCVKELKLGTLLQTIADATHTRFKSETIEYEGKKQRVYRIYRTAKDQEDIAAVLKAQHDTYIAQASWGWDALVSASKAPATGEKLEAWQREIYDVAKPLGTILDGLGSQVKERVMAGIPVRVRGSDPLFASAVSEICLAVWKNHRNKSTQPSETSDWEDPTDEAIRNAHIEIRREESGYYSLTDIIANIGVQLGPSSFLNNGHFITGDANMMSRIKDIKLPPRPKLAQQVLPKTEMPSDKWIWVYQLNKDANVKIKIERPEGKSEPTIADYISALSKASSSNIVIEDFKSSHFGKPAKIDIKNRFVETLLLTAFQSSYSIQWLNNSTDNMYLGWDSNWRESHYSLLPESYLNYIWDRLNGDGLSVDDAAGLLSLTPDQAYEWIDDSKDFAQLHSMRRTENLWLWQLYNSLKPEDKRLAKSEAGIPLSKLDTNWVISLVSEWQKGSSAGQVRSVNASDDTDDTELKNYSFLTNPDWIRSLVLKDKSEPAKSYRAVNLGDYSASFDQNPVPQGLALQSCWIEASGERNGEKAIFTTSHDMAFPIYSSKRMKALQEKIKTQK